MCPLRVVTLPFVATFSRAYKKRCFFRKLKKRLVFFKVETPTKYFLAPPFILLAFKNVFALTKMSATKILKTAIAVWLIKLCFLCLAHICIFSR